ncbi:MAG: hypothetical protein KDC34_19225 [Saprospiraceae bacterium]|nr:hypothetical protein [Saprospiraceae bacterium]
MPKTPSSKLFDLVKSLSGSEKRYFKLFVRGDDRDNKYLRLFEAIENQETFEEESLKKEIYGSQRIESRKYSELKSYLYDLILKSLQQYDEKGSIDARLKTYLLDIRVLFKRSHFDECFERMQKARKIAKRYEHFTALLELLQWEKKIAYAQTNIARLDKELPRTRREEAHYLWQQQLVANYRNLLLQLLITLRKDASLRSENQADQLETLMSDPLLQELPAGSSYHAQVLYHRIYGVYHYGRQDFPKFFESSKTLLKIMESQPHFLKEDVSEYISALYNFIFSCGWLKAYKELELGLEKLSNVAPITLDDELKVHRQYYMAKFSYCILKGDFKEGLRALNTHQQALEKFPDPAFRKNTFYLQYFYIHFGNRNYSEALTFLNEWLNLSGNIERRDLQSLSRILNLILHYEMGNSLLLDSLLRSTYRYLRKQERIFQYEQLMLNFFRTLGRAADRTKTKEAFLQLKEDLHPLFELAPEKPMLELFDILAWVESKIKQKDFGEVKQDWFNQSLSN